MPKSEKCVFFTCLESVRIKGFVKIGIFYPFWEANDKTNEAEKDKNFTPKNEKTEVTVIFKEYDLKKGRVMTSVRR